MINKLKNKLINFINIHKLTDYYSRAKDYNNSNHIKNISIEFDSLSVLVKSSVIGNYKYSSSLLLKNDKITSKCTCPTEDYICKHSLALAMFFIDNDNTLLPMSINIEKNKSDLLTKINNLTVEELRLLAIFLSSNKNSMLKANSYIDSLKLR